HRQRNLAKRNQRRRQRQRGIGHRRRGAGRERGELKTRRIGGIDGLRIGGDRFRRQRGKLRRALRRRCQRNRGRDRQSGGLRGGGDDRRGRRRRTLFDLRGLLRDRRGLGRGDRAAGNGDGLFRRHQGGPDGRHRRRERDVHRVTAAVG